MQKLWLLYEISKRMLHIGFVRQKAGGRRQEAEEIIGCMYFIYL
jgi:hypothetical protein